jgi:hypothetical protein
MLLVHARNRVREIVPYNAGRARLAQLYSGRLTEEWFLIEVILCFNVLLEYRAGIAFLDRIAKKTTHKCVAWDQAILTNVASFLKHDTGCEFLRDFIAANLLDQSVQNAARNIFMSFASQDDKAFRNLMRSLIQIYHNNTQVLQPLLQYRWDQAADCSFLVDLIELTAESVSRPTIGCFLENPLPFCTNVSSARVIVAILRCGTAEQNGHLIAQLLPSFALFVFSDPEWQIAHELLCVGTVSDKLSMVALLQDRLLSVDRFPPHVEGLIVHLLWSMPARTRKIFIAKTETARKAMNMSLIDRAIADLEKITRLPSA